jgi:PKD repeat protein
LDKVGSASPISYHWDFGDGVVADGASLTHTYTAAGTYKVAFTGEGLDGISAEKTFSITVSGAVILPPPRRYVRPSE